MNGRRTLGLVIVLALLCAGGIIGMLLAESVVVDTLFFTLTALPLLVGAWRAAVARRQLRR